jgi:hypothetical protein
VAPANRVRRTRPPSRDREASHARGGSRRPWRDCSTGSRSPASFVSLRRRPWPAEDQAATACASRRIEMIPGHRPIFAGLAARCATIASLPAPVAGPPPLGTRRGERRATPSPPRPGKNCRPDRSPPGNKTTAKVGKSDSEGVSTAEMIRAANLAWNTSTGLTLKGLKSWHCSSLRSAADWGQPAHASGTPSRVPTRADSTLSMSTKFDTAFARKCGAAQRRLILMPSSKCLARRRR